MKEVLKNKVALVTGGAQGIGLGIADALKKRGAQVAVCDLKETKKYFFVKCDISNSSDVKNLISKVIAKFKKIDILVNNAGIYPFKSFKDMTESDWDKVIDINLKGVFNCTKAVLPFMEKQKCGKIISITSIAGTTVGFPNLTHYCASKSGIQGFTRALAIELAPLKINVNAIAPGVILTPGVKSTMAKKQISQMLNIIPAKRLGLPKDIGETAAFLASDSADYITGQTIVVDGGYTLN